MNKRTIYCPVDFSAAANNAVEYAAQFAQSCDAKITLVHYQDLPVVYTGEETPGVLKAFDDQHQEIRKKVFAYSQAVHEEFNIDCDFTEEFYVGEKSGTSEVSEEHSNDFFIMGTNGADTLFQFYRGSNSFRLAKQVMCPVLIVPENYRFKKISRVLFVSDYNKNDTILLQQLKAFLPYFNAHLDVLHISHKDTVLSMEVYKSFRNITHELLEYDTNIEFHRMVSEDIEEGIMSFINKISPDILAITMVPHGIPYRLFHSDLIKKISAYTEIPMLVIHK